MRSKDVFRRWLPAVGAAVPVVVLPIAILTIPLRAAQELSLSQSAIVSWILALYGLPALLSLLFTIRYRQPLLFTGNVFVLIFIASLGDQLLFSDLVGAAIVAGVGVLVLTALGLSSRLALWIPEPVVLGLLAGAVMPFVSDVFTMLGEAPVLVGGSFLAYLWGRHSLGDRLPAILPALIVGLVIAGLSGLLNPISASLELPIPELTAPTFSLHAIATASPVFMIMITLQANIPSFVFLKGQGYAPPERLTNIVSGFATVLGSLLGPTGVSLSLPVTSIVAGETAGAHAFRHRAVYLASGAVLLIGLFARIAADLPEAVPEALLLTLAGLAVVDVLANALQKITSGPVLLGPLFAFAIALSDIAAFGFGPFFWALVIGTAVSLLLEGDALKQTRAKAST